MTEPIRDPVLQARELSISAIMYQNLRLLEGLLEVAGGFEQAPEASRLAQLLYALASRTYELLEVSRRNPPPLSLSETEVVLSLAETTQVIHSWLRYFHSASIQRCPEALQCIVSSLVRRFVVSAFNCRSEDLAVLVRPQWHYSVKFIDVIGLFASEIELHILEADEFMPASSDADDRSRMSTLIDRIWRARKADDSNEFGFQQFEGEAPRFPAILSFSSLDNDDALLYPLLAHEVGHLIDLCHPGGRIHERGIYLDTSDEQLPGTSSTAPLECMTTASLRVDVLARENRTDEMFLGICLAEIAADLIATRMFGPSYFIALAEYFKTKFSLDAMILDEESGYPAAQYRLRYVLRELELLCPDVFQEGAAECRVPRDHAAGYLRAWRTKLESMTFTQGSGDREPAALAKQVADSLENRLAQLRLHISTVIPVGEAYRPSAEIDRIVQELSAGKVPARSDPKRHRLEEGPLSAAQWMGDVLFAAWIYQLAIGDAAEEEQQSVAVGRETYSDLCRRISIALCGGEQPQRLDRIHTERPVQPSANDSEAG